MGPSRKKSREKEGHFKFRRKGEKSKEIDEAELKFGVYSIIEV